MSLINQMLQDLDKRHDGALLADQHPQVHAVPSAPRRPVATWWLVLFLILVLAGTGTWLALRSSWRTTGPQPALAAANAPKTVAITAPAAKTVVAAAAMPPTLAAAAPIIAATAAPAAPAVTPAAARAQSIPDQPPLPRRASSKPSAVAAGSEPAAASAAPSTQAKTVAELADQPKPLAGHALPPMAAANTAARRAPEVLAVQPKIAAAAPAPLTIAERRPGAHSAAVTSTAAHAGEFPSAPALSKDIQGLTPQQQAENAFRRAALLLQQGDVPAAQAGLEQALQLDPRHAAARQTLAGLLLDSKHSQAAVDTLQAGLRLDPAQPGMAMILARIQVEKNGVGPALETLRRTLPYAVERADYQAFLAALLQRAGQHPEAIEHYRLALSKAPDNGVWWMGLGISLRAASRSADAQEAFSRAVSSNGLSPQLRAFVEQQLQQLH